MIESLLTANLPILIFAKDKNLKYLFCNEAMAEVGGLDSPKQSIGKTDHGFIWKTRADLYLDEDKNVFQGKMMMNVQQGHTQITGEKTILVSKTVLMDTNGYQNGIIGHAVDITGYTVTKNNGHIEPEKNIFHLGSNFSNEYLTKREFEVFKYLLSGKSVEEIALILSRSAKTIQVQIKSISNKLQCAHKSEIVPTAIKYGLTHVLNDLSIVKK